MCPLITASIEILGGGAALAGTGIAVGSEVVAVGAWRAGLFTVK